MTTLSSLAAPQLVFLTTCGAASDNINCMTYHSFQCRWSVDSLHKGPVIRTGFPFPWWRHDMKTISASLALYEGNPPVMDFSRKGPVMRRPAFSLMVVWINSVIKQSNCRWLETPWCSHNVMTLCEHHGVSSHRWFNCLFDITDGYK